MNIPLINTSFQNVIPASPSPVPGNQLVAGADSLTSTIPPVLETETAASLSNSGSPSLPIPLPQPVLNGQVTAAPVAKEATPNGANNSSTVPAVGNSNDNVNDVGSGGANNGNMDAAQSGAGIDARQPAGEASGKVGRTQDGGPFGVSNNGPANSAAPDEGEQGSSNDNEASLSPEEMTQLQALAARDRDVRVHERAHQSAGGQYTGAASFSFQRGPDGVQYAIGGEVPIDVSPVAGDPQATIEKMQVVRRAANAPADPSAADRSVSAAATRIMLQAQNDLLSQRQQERQVQAEQAKQQRASNDNGRSEAIQTYSQLNGIGVEGENAQDIAKLLPQLDLSI